MDWKCLPVKNGLVPWQGGSSGSEPGASAPATVISPCGQGAPKNFYLMVRKFRLPLLPWLLLPWLLERALRLLRWLPERLLWRWFGRPLAASRGCWTCEAMLPPAIHSLPWY